MSTRQLIVREKRTVLSFFFFFCNCIVPFKFALGVSNWKKRIKCMCSSRKVTVYSLITSVVQYSTEKLMDFINVYIVRIK